MKRLRITPIILLSTFLLVVACRGEETPAPTAAPTLAATDAATATPAAARGESPAGVADPAAPVAAPADTAAARGIIYSIPFAVQPDGFGFRNYGPGYPEGDFTIADLRQQFGDAVCSRTDVDGEECIPSAEAQQWIDDRNADMRTGHCIGFTVASYRFAEGQLRPADFSASADSPFDIAQEAPIMRAIALNGSLYWVKSVWSSEVAGAPRDIVDALIALGEPVDLSIFLPGLVGGHSLLAYGVAEVAPGQYHILVYDNNFPGEEAFVEVDYAANTWRYAQGAVNPDETAVPYEGDATTETLRFIPLSAYDAATCPFCPADGDTDAAEDAITLVSFLGQGEMLVKTALGAIGSVAGELINEIPGAQLILVRGQLAGDGAPDVALPAGVDFTVEFDSLERVSSLSPELSLVVDHLSPAAEKNRLAVAPGGRNFEFQAGGDQAPSLSVTIRQGGAAYQATLLGVDFADGQAVSMGAPESGTGLELRSREIDVTNATLLLTRLTNEDEAVFATTSFDIQGGGGVTLDIGQWDGSGSIDQFKDDDGDGDYDERPTELTNEPLDKVLQNSDAGDVGSIIGALTPFLGDRGLEALLASLAEQELSGQEIGQLLLPFQLTDEQLIEVIPPLALPVIEVGELLFALRLEPPRVETVSEGLELETEDEAALRAYLDDLALFQEIIADWLFLQSDDLGELAALLSARELTPDQLVLLLPRLVLSAAEIEQVLGQLNLSTPDLVEVVEQLDVNMPPTATPTPTLSLTQTVTATTPTITPTPGAAVTITATATISATATAGPLPTPTGTPAPDSYPGIPPLPTATPGGYPYPGPEPSPTGDPDAYPVDPTATPDYDSAAFCVGDDLQVVAEEPTWDEGTVIEIWAGEELLFTGEIGPDDEPLAVILAGPGTWEELVIEADGEPERVLLGSMTCPAQE